MIVLHDVTKRYGGRVAVTGASFTVPGSGRTAVLGVNGAGKSTLLRLIAGVAAPDDGTITMPPGFTLAYVPQDFGAAGDDRRTGHELLHERLGTAPLARLLQRLTPAVEAGDPAALAAYGDALEQFESLGGYGADARIERALSQVGLGGGVLRRQVATLSGGEQVRLGLAGILASSYDLYLLDEPTNHLDRDGVELLEDFLLSGSATVMFVTHDRQMLSRVTTHVVSIDETTHQVSLHHQTYEEHRATGEAARSAQRQRHREYLAEVERLQAGARAQSPAAARRRDHRPARDNDKFAGHFLTQRAAGQAANTAQRLQRRIERLDAVAAPETPWELRLSLDSGARSGERVVSAVGAMTQAGAFRLGPIDLDVVSGERVALVGPNGSGKTLLLEMLAGDAVPDDGRILRGAAVRIGYLRQGGLRAREGASALEVFRTITGWEEAESRTLLAKFDLGVHHVLRALSSYSPGERCRLGLATIMAQRANFLVLDEPTNHLDIEAREQLQQAIAGYDGTVLVVSHDRHFLDTIGITRRVRLRHGRVVADVAQ